MTSLAEMGCLTALYPRLVVDALRAVLGGRRFRVATSWAWDSASPQERQEVEDWMMRLDHRLTYESGLPEDRFRELVAEKVREFDAVERG